MRNKTIAPAGHPEAGRAQGKARTGVAVTHRAMPAGTFLAHYGPPRGRLISLISHYRAFPRMVPTNISTITLHGSAWNCIAEYSIQLYSNRVFQ